MLFLFFMVPLPQSFVNVVAFPLQLIAADFAVETLHLLHIPALREGNIIHLADTQLFVAEACAGLRSLMALGALAVVFAYFFRKNPIERVIIVASAIPIAIFVNAFRVALTGYLAHRMGSAAAQGLIHQTEGFFTFGLAFGLLLVEAWLLSMFWPRKLAAVAQEGAGMIKLSVALVFLGLNFYTYHYLATDPFFRTEKASRISPISWESWSCRERQLMDDETHRQSRRNRLSPLQLRESGIRRHCGRLSWVTTPARFAKRVVAPESTRSTRPPTAYRDRVGTSSTIAWWSSICPACPRFPQP